MGPKFSFGSRFDSDVRSQAHLRPKKVDGPGPGDYALPSSIKQNDRDKQSHQRSTWGNGEREWSYLPKKDDKGNKKNKDNIMYKKHQPEKIIYQSELPGYLFPKMQKQEMSAKDKNMAHIGPDKYHIPPLAQGTAKRILGGSLKPPQLVDDLVPGPGAYEADAKQSVPGFVIAAPRKKTPNKDEKKEPVGPQRYDPHCPAHTSKSIKFGTSVRSELGGNKYTPAPNKY